MKYKLACETPREFIFLPKTLDRERESVKPVKRARMFCIMLETLLHCY